MTLLVDEDISDYHAHESVSHSKLRDFDQLGPKGFYLRHVRREAPRADTKALRNGRAFETFLCEPKRFDEWFVVKPADYKGTEKKWKAWVEAEEASGKTVIDRKDHAAFEHMESAIRECGAASALLEGSTYQPTWRREWAGLPGLQARPDWANMGGCPFSDYRPFTLDLKTTRALDDLTTGRSIVKYGYHSQAATVRLASEQTDMAHYLLAVEKAFPCRAVVIEVSRVFVDIGERWARATMERLSEHYSADFWPLVAHDSLLVEPPAWLLNQHYEQVEAEGFGDEDESFEDIEAEAANP